MRPAPLALALILAAPVLAAPTIAARAEDAPDPSSIAAFATAHEDCSEWGDGCFVCQRDGSKAGFSCSVPGPACQPKPLACVVAKQP